MQNRQQKELQRLEEALMETDLSPTQPTSSGSTPMLTVQLTPAYTAILSKLPQSDMRISL